MPGIVWFNFFEASQKTKVIGIRKVLGATVGGIVVLLSKDFLILIVISACMAIPAAWYLMTRWLENFAFKLPLPGGCSPWPG